MVITAAVEDLTAAHQRMTLFWHSGALIYPLILLSEKVNWGQSARGTENRGKTLPTWNSSLNLLSMLSAQPYEGKEINPSSPHTDADSWRLASLSCFVTDQIQRRPLLEENTFMKPCWNIRTGYFLFFFLKVLLIKINSEICTSIRMSQSLLTQLIYNLTAAQQIIPSISFFLSLTGSFLCHWCLFLSI